MVWGEVVLRRGHCHDVEQVATC